MKHLKTIVVAGFLAVAGGGMAQAEEQPPAPTQATPTQDAPTPDAKAPDVPVAREAVVAPDEIVTDTFETLMGALEDGSYSAFLAPTNANFKAALPKVAFDKVVEMMAPRLKKGNKASFIDGVIRKGASTYLWKLKFEDKGDEIIALLTIQDGKAAGFLLI